MKLRMLQFENGLSDCLVEFFATNQATLQRKTSFSHHLDCQIQVKEGMRKREIYIKPTKVVDIGELVHFPLSIKVTKAGIVTRFQRGLSCSWSSIVLKIVIQVPKRY